MNIFGSLKNCQAYHPSKYLSTFFSSYGVLAARYWTFSLCIPLLWTISCLYGVLQLKNTVLFKAFIPLEARYMKDYETLSSSWESLARIFNIDSHRCSAILVLQRSQSNMLERKVMKEVQLVDSIITKLTNKSYYEQCYKLSRFCIADNGFLKLYKHFNVSGSTMNFTFPTMQFGESTAYFVGVLGGVETLPGPNRQALVIKSVQAIQLNYYLDITSGTEHDRIDQWHKRFFNLQSENLKLKYVKSYWLSQNSFHDSLESSGGLIVKRLPLFGLFMILVLYAVTTKFNLMKCSIDCERSCSGIALLGLLSSGLACLTVFGILSYLKVTYMSIFLMIPFFIIAISLDDSIVIMNEYVRLKETFPDSQTDSIIGKTLETCGVPVLFTSMTTALAFVGGLTASIQAIRLISIYSVSLVAANYAYLMTFFIGAVVARDKIIPRIRCCRFSSAQGGALSSEADKFSCVTSIVRVYVNFVLKTKVGRCVVLIVLILLWIISIFGATKLAAHASLTSHLSRSSPPMLFDSMARKYNLSGFSGFELPVVVNSVPDLSNPINRAWLHVMVGKFENTKYTMESVSTKFWLRRFEGDIADTGDPNRKILWTNKLEAWSHLASVKHTDATFMRFRASSPAEVADCKECHHRLESFIVLISLTTAHAENTVASTKFLHSIADADEFAGLNLTVLPPGGYLADMTDALKHLNAMSMLTAAVAVSCISIFLIADIRVAVCVILSIPSIDLCTVGMMGLAGVKINLTTVLVMFMGIGVSVDYTIHVAAACMQNPELEPVERIGRALCNVGGSVMQCVLTTLIGALSLLGLDIASMDDFSHTLIIVILTGAVHAVIFQPVVMCILFGATCSRKK